ncbi:hypothetical protein [Pseudonocardia phyllosphaerae]|uniref:hypothetical protein n=1 Tax=Pseudonocardia phyllosphaerae TaxID=3390502 RepID=UPI00397B1636
MSDTQEHDSTKSDSAKAMDLSEVSSSHLRDRLSARSDGLDDQVVTAAGDLRTSVDRLVAALGRKKTELLQKAVGLARTAAPVAGGVAVAGIGVAVLVHKIKQHKRAKYRLPAVEDYAWAHLGEEEHADRAAA